MNQKNGFDFNLIEKWAYWNKKCLQLLRDRLYPADKPRQGRDRNWTIIDMQK